MSEKNTWVYLCPSLLSAALVTMVAPAAWATISPISQSRNVSANATAIVPTITDTHNDALSAPGFAPFSAEVDPSALAFSPTSGLFAFASGVAKQNSSIGASAISGQGESSVNGTLLRGAGVSASATGSSGFDLVFLLNSLSTFTLSGLVDTASVVTGGASVPSLSNGVQLIDVDNGNAVLFSTATFDEAFLWSGTLPAGTYQLLADADVSGTSPASLTAPRTFNGISSYEFRMAFVPVPVPEASTVIGGMGLAGVCAATWLKRRSLARKALTAEAAA